MSESSLIFRIMNKSLNVTDIEAFDIFEHILPTSCINFHV